MKKRWSLTGITIHELNEPLSHILIEANKNWRTYREHSERIQLWEESGEEHYTKARHGPTPILRFNFVLKSEKNEVT